MRHNSKSFALLRDIKYYFENCFKHMHKIFFYIFLKIDGAYKVIKNVQQGNIKRVFKVDEQN